VQNTATVKLPKQPSDQWWRFITVMFRRL